MKVFQHFATVITAPLDFFVKMTKSLEDNIPFFPYLLLAAAAEYSLMTRTYQAFEHSVLKVSWLEKENALRAAVGKAIIFVKLYLSKLWTVLKTHTAVICMHWALDALFRFLQHSFIRLYGFLWPSFFRPHQNIIDYPEEQSRWRGFIKASFAPLIRYSVVYWEPIFYPLCCSALSYYYQGTYGFLLYFLSFGLFDYQTLFAFCSKSVHEYAHLLDLSFGFDHPDLPSFSYCPENPVQPLDLESQTPSSPLAEPSSHFSTLSMSSRPAASKDLPDFETLTAH